MRSMYVRVSLFLPRLYINTSIKNALYDPHLKLQESLLYSLFAMKNNIVARRYGAQYLIKSTANTSEQSLQSFFTGKHNRSYNGRHERITTILSRVIKAYH
jgi:hypothetical protein